ncbi:formin-like protein 5 [Trichosurus vulpecula]|uniref:formin-like protein 5 n=1 Tax=Trichosurus vulpecula TaxID=9337 RepID=UPI00186AC7EA|nr:formin-like protein 5 [Trichosurus vulpecula]
MGGTAQSGDGALVGGPVSRLSGTMTGTLKPQQLEGRICGEEQSGATSLERGDEHHERQASLAESGSEPGRPPRSLLRQLQVLSQPDPRVSRRGEGMSHNEGRRRFRRKCPPRLPNMATAGAGFALPAGGATSRAAWPQVSRGRGDCRGPEGAGRKGRRGRRPGLGPGPGPRQRGARGRGGAGRRAESPASPQAWPGARRKHLQLPGPHPWPGPGAGPQPPGTPPQPGSSTGGHPPPTPRLPQGCAARLPPPPPPPGNSPTSPRASVSFCVT